MQIIKKFGPKSVQFAKHVHCYYAYYKKNVKFWNFWSLTVWLFVYTGKYNTVIGKGKGAMKDLIQLSVPN